jgi:hypothetical protein
MLSWVFFAQPIGQLLANVLSLAAVEAYGPYIEKNMHYCPPTDDQCFRAIDRLWRLVIGIGIIPAVIALAFRFTIPESPRYTLDVLQNTQGTLEDTTNYYGAPELHPEAGHGHGQGHIEMRATTPEIHIARCTSTCSEIGLDEDVGSDSESERRPSDTHLRYTTPTPELLPGDPNYVPPLASWVDAKKFFITEGNWQYLLGTSLAWLFLDFACMCPIAVPIRCTDKRCSLRSRPFLSRNRQPHLGPTRATQWQHPQISFRLHHFTRQQSTYASYGIHRYRHRRATHDQNRKARFPQSHPVLGLHRAVHTLHRNRQRVDKVAQHRPVRLDCTLRAVSYRIQPRSKRHHLHRK